MTSYHVKRSTIKIDPMFNIPPGMDEIEYKDEIDADSLGEALFNELYGNEDGEGEDDLPPAPEVIEIVSQKLRRIKGGTDVVDVVFEVEEIEGAAEYELRWVKL